MLRTLVIACGIAAESVGWWLIVRGRGSVWRTLIPLYCAEAIVAVSLRPAALSGDRGVLEAIAIGVGSGLVLYVATRGFVEVASRWARFERAVAEDYSQAQDVSPASAIVLSAAVAAPTEEIFWRGLVIGTLHEHASILAAATLAWCGYVVVKAFSRSLPLLAGAVVGGAMWSWLAGWSGGVLAPICSHVGWTALMVAAPPIQGRAAAS